MRIVLSCMLICTMADDVTEARPNRMLWGVLRVLAVMFIQYLFILFFFFVKIPVQLLTSINMHLG